MRSPRTSVLPDLLLLVSGCRDCLAPNFLTATLLGLEPTPYLTGHVHQALVPLSALGLVMASPEKVGTLGWVRTQVCSLEKPAIFFFYLSFRVPPLPSPQNTHLGCPQGLFQALSSGGGTLRTIWNERVPIRTWFSTPARCAVHLLTSLTTLVLS